MILFQYKNKYLPLLKTAIFQGLSQAQKANVPTLGPRFIVKFPRVGKAIETKRPRYARGLPSFGLNIHRCIIFPRIGIFQRYINNSYHLARNVHGDLSDDIICSEKRTVFQERSCELWETDNVQGKISEDFLVPNACRLLCLLSFKYFSQKSTRIFPNFSWGNIWSRDVFKQVMPEFWKVLEP